MSGVLAAELAGPAAAVLTASELEDLLDERGRAVLKQLLQDHYDLRKVREEQQAREDRAPVTGTDGITRTRLETGHGRALATLFGTVTVTRCAWRKPGAGNWCPADAALSLPAGRHSHCLAKLAAIEAARGSFAAAHAAIARRCGPVMGKRQAEESVVHAAADIPAFYAAPIPEPCTASALVVLPADCKGIVMRPGALRAATAKAAARLGKMRTRLSAGEKPNRKRMAALVTVYDAEPAKRRPHDVIAPPGGRSGARPLRPGPKALAKWLAGSVRTDPAEVIAAAFDEAEARDPGHLRTWVVLVDGAEHQLDLVRAEAARRDASSTSSSISSTSSNTSGRRRGACTTPGTAPPRTGSRSRPSPCWPATAPGPPPRSPLRPTPPDWKETGAPGPTHASATWETSTSVFATTRPSRPAGRSRPGSSRAHAAT